MNKGGDLSVSLFDDHNLIGFHISQYIDQATGPTYLNEIRPKMSPQAKVQAKVVA